jgi:bacteriorhodopsin
MNIGEIKNQDLVDFIPRYVDWLCTTPLLLFTILATCKIQNYQFYMYIIILDILMIIVGYLAAIQTSVGSQLTLFSLSMFFFLYLFIVLKICQPPLLLYLFLIFSWLLYPIVWYLYYMQHINNQQYNYIISSVDIFSKIGYGFILPI